MDDPSIGGEPTPWQALGGAMVPTCSPPPTRARTTIPKAIHEIVGELKVRFQHGSGGDPEGFRARAALLAEDLADVPVELLRVAVNAWVREQPFMPTAADLTRLMRDELERRDRAADDASAARRRTGRDGHDEAEAFCSSRNADLPRAPDTSRPIEWHVDGSGEPRLRHVREDRAHVERVAVADVARLNAALAKYSAPFRYASDGYPYDLAGSDQHG